MKVEISKEQAIRWFANFKAMCHETFVTNEEADVNFPDYLCDAKKTFDELKAIMFMFVAENKQQSK